MEAFPGYVAVVDADGFYIYANQRLAVRQVVGVKTGSDLASAVIRTVGLNPERVNPMGGAIALGHPLGATGAIRAATVVHALHRQQLKYGMVTMCVGMGQGAAGIFERV